MALDVIVYVALPLLAVVGFIFLASSLFNNTRK